MAAPAGPDCDDDRLEALARAWLPCLADPSASRAGIEHLLNEAARAGDPHLGWMSQAWSAIARSRGTVAPEDLRALQDDVLQLRGQGWPRAIRLAEAALAAALHRVPRRRAEAIALLQSHGAAGDDPRPPIERVWTDASLSLLLTAVGRHADALVAALAADQLALQASEPAVTFAAARALSYLFLSTGDVEAALEVLDRERDASIRTGIGGIATDGNLALGWLLAGQPERVLALVAQRPALLEAASRSPNPTLLTMIACAHARCGQVDRALTLLRPDAQPVDDDPALRANRAWLTASVFLAAGQAGRARADLQAFLAEAASRDEVLSPMNGTQIHRVLADACESLGDMSGALTALKASQSHCFAWVASSVGMRLQALAARATPVGPAQRTRDALRLQAVDDAAGAGTDDAATSGQQRFVSKVAHELRNPLNGVIGMTSLLMMSKLDERQQRYVKLAQTSAQMMLRLCSDLLDLARIDAGQFSLHLDAAAIGELLRHCVATFEPLATQKGLTLTLVLAPGLPPRVLADATRVQQVTMNLLSNAVKFSRAGEIVVRAHWRASPGHLRVEVVDSGPGLSAEARTHLFQEFAQLDRRPEGTGLGLALCRSLVHKMGGVIDFDSPPGGGCTFWFELPMEVAEPITPA